MSLSVLAALGVFASVSWLVLLVATDFSVLAVAVGLFALVLVTQRNR